MLSLARNGFTSAQVMMALHAAKGSRKVAYRHYVVDAYDGSVIRQIHSVTGCRIKHKVSDKIARTASYTFRRQNIVLSAFNLVAAKGGGLIGYWRLGETSGTSASDSSPTGNAGTYTGGFTLAQDGLLTDDTNLATRFNGSSGYVTIPHHANYNVSAITVAAIIKTSAAATQSIVSRDDATNRVFDFTVQSNGNLRIQFSFTAASGISFDTGVVVNDNKTHNVVATYDGIHVQVFIDSIRVLSTAETRTLNTPTLGIQIGRRGNNTQFFSGVIDEVRVYSRALTSSEIRESYQASRRDLSEFDSTRDRIKPEWGIRVGSGDDLDVDYAWFPRGLFLMTAPDENFDETGEEIAMECPDQTRILLDDAVTAPYTVASGTLYTTAMSTLLATTIINLRNITPNATLALPADRLWPTGTNKDQILDDLAFAAVYDRQWFDSDGFIRLHPNVADADRQPEYEYSDTQAGVRMPVVLKQMKAKTDLDAVPNRLIVVRSEPELGNNIQVISNTDINSPVSIPRRGYVKVKVIQVEAADETNSLTAIGKISLRSESKVLRDIQFETPNMPMHEHKDAFTLRNTRAREQGTVIENEWEMDFTDGAAMPHGVSHPVTVV